MEEVQELEIGACDDELKVYGRATGVGELTEHERVSKGCGIIGSPTELYVPVLLGITGGANNKLRESTRSGTSAYCTMCLHRNGLEECSLNNHSIQCLPSVRVVFGTEQRDTLLVC